MAPAVGPAIACSDDRTEARAALAEHLGFWASARLSGWAVRRQQMVKRSSSVGRSAKSVLARSRARAVT